MTMLDPQAALDVAREAARAGADVIGRFYREGVTMREKGASDLVSDADTGAEDAIVRVIHGHHPTHAILAEEGRHGDTAPGPDAEHLWVVDPLDGTTNFAHRIPHFAVSIAYYHAGAAVAGVVHNPARGDWYTAVRGGGAFHDGAPVRVGTEARLDASLIGVGFYYDRGAMMVATLDAIRALFERNIHGIRRFGTASLDLCHVGLGLYGAYFEYTLSPWDFAAGRLFVEEAGGRVTTCTGEALPLARTSLLASNTQLHDEVLAVVGARVPASPASAWGQAR